MCIYVCLTRIGEFYSSGFLFAAFAELLDNAVDEVFVALAWFQRKFSFRFFFLTADDFV